MQSWQSPWLVEYRRPQCRPRQIMSMKMVLRMSFKQVAKEYARNCSVAGLNKITDPNMSWKRRCLWLAMFTTLFCLVCYFLIYTWVTTLSNPLILMPQYSTYPIANIDYPAIALCNVNRISMKAVKRLAMDLYKRNYFENVSLNRLEEFLVNNGRLLDFSDIGKWSTPLSDSGFLVQTKNYFDTYLVKDGMKKLAPDCEDMLIRCAWAGAQVNCTELFKMRRTARGHCCAFNYVLNFDTEGYPNKSLRALRQTRPGFLHGLNVVIDPMLDDYAYPLSIFRGFDVLIFEPTDFADPSAGRVLHRLAEPNRLEFLELKSIKQTATKEVRKYPVSVRKCIFQDENKADYHNLYSYSACIVRCKIKYLLSVCQCAPYFLPMGRYEGPVCLLSDEPCLNKYKDKLSYLHPPETKYDEGDLELQDSLYCPGCYPDCEHTRHVTRSYKTSINTLSIDKYFAFGFGDGLNMTGKCVLSIYFASPESELERLDVVSYWYQIISNIGGFSGILIGFSVFSVVEILYFWLFRYSQVVYQNYVNFY